MNDDPRPDPDALLAALQREKDRRGKGRLRIFFGMCAGVGKTYAMLQAARALKSKGADVVVGLVETHGRNETESLLDGLPTIVRIPVKYRGMTAEEMDLEEILRRKPRYVLVDELAHTNTPGMRHEKRYQDVLEIIDNGVNVLATLNVQHLESLVDTVRQISGVTVRETLPDSILDAADEIELIDISPEELLQRLTEGKVYTPERSAAAISHFFRRGNLTALREIALRITAQRVNLQLRDFMREHRIAGPWKTVERLMVAVGPSPYSEQLIRWTKRIADTMQAPWVAVYIQTTKPLTEESEKRLKKNTALAQELGASLVTTTDDDIVKALIRTARRDNVTQIIIGKSMTSPIIDLLHGGSLVNRLIRESGEIDIYVVRGETEPSERPRTRFPHPAFPSPVWQCLAACAAVAVSAAACLALAASIDYRSIGMLFLFVIAVLSLVVGRGPIVLAALLSALLWDFLFIPPRFTFSIARASDLFLVFLFFLIALVTGTLTSRIRGQKETVRSRELQTSSLYSLVNDLSAAETPDAVAAIAVGHLGADFDASVACFLADAAVEIGPPHSSSTLRADSEKELSVVKWVHLNRKPAGRATGTLPFADATYYPLIDREQCHGVIGFRRVTGRVLPFAKEGQLRMSLHQISLALERLHLRAERLSTTLLRSISHELRTPITAITGASSALADPTTRANPAAQEQLIEDIQTAAGRLNRLVENLLNMTRIESGAVALRKQWCDVNDLIGSVVRELRQELAGHSPSVTIHDDMPLVELDSVLVGQALANVLINAAQYTPPKTAITVSAAYEDGALTLSVEDAGPGFPADSMGRLFEKFYRVPGSRPGGTGLGLSIAKGFVESHGGTIEAGNRAEGGARVTMRLPVRQTAMTPGEERAHV